MSFIRAVLATIIGLFIFLAIIVLMFIGAAGVASSSEAPSVSDNSVLYLNLNGVVAERVAEDPFQEILPQDGPQPLGLLSFLEAIAFAKEDTKIKGIYMEHGFIAGGNASLQEMRDAIIDFKSSGKFVYSYGEFMSEADYYLASAADSVFLNPEGSVEFNGFSAGISFFKGTFDKLGIEPQIFRVGEFKSAVEPFIRKDLSEENEMQISSFINSVYDYYVQQVAESRNIDIDQLMKVSDSMLVRLPKDAVTYGLVDKLSYEDEVKDLIRDQLEIGEDDKIKFVSYKKYEKYAEMESAQYSSNRVAVIVASGDIVMGNGTPDNIGAEKFAREIKKARENDRVKAIVLRVNSPGGGLTASDIIWREIMLTKGKKPIIASMSDLAASGGYFISMPCDTIIAQPNTITGSIGIFGMLFNMEEFLEDKLGITNEVVNTGEFSDLFTVTRPLSAYEKSIIQMGVEKGYDTFVTKAAAGRDMSLEDLKAVAGGRVWTGEQALANGLVDALGSFQDAVDIAAAVADISDDYKVSYYPPKETFLDQVLKKSQEQISLRLLEANFGELAPYIQKVKNLNQYKGIQARMPYELHMQ